MTPLLLGHEPNGRPRWRDGFVGSLSHCGGHDAIAVLPEARARGIGIDIERVVQLDEHTAASFLTAPDRVELAMLFSAAGLHAPLIAFSMKEAVFKALPDPQPMGLRDVAVSATVASSGSGAFLGGTRDEPGTCFGQWFLTGSFVVTLAVRP